MITDAKPFTVEYYPPGTGIAPDELQAGDIGLTRSLDSLMGKVVNFFDKSFYTHTFSGYKPGGIIAESREWGVEVEDVEKYFENHYYAVVRLDATPEQRLEMFNFMNSVVLSENNSYGYLIILSLALSLSTGHKINFGAGVGTNICSGFSAETSTRAGYIYPEPSAYMTPGGIARKFDVETPSIFDTQLHKVKTHELELYPSYAG